MSGAIVNQETMRQLAAVREALSQRLSPDVVKATFNQPSSAISGLKGESPSAAKRRYRPSGSTPRSWRTPSCSC